MKNTFNVSELLKRLGVVGDSQGSAELLDQLRLGIQIADLTQLVPPLRGPIGAGSAHIIPGVGNAPNWSLQCRAPGGLQMLTADLVTTPNNTSELSIFITAANPWAAPAVVPQEQFAFGQVADSVLTTGTPVPVLAPASAIVIPHGEATALVKNIWLGPGLFLNFENNLLNNPMEFALSWLEYPGMLNP